ncbi:MAG: hypothetical protein AAFQ54_11810 [Pseudomonadota bacterium]
MSTVLASLTLNLDTITGTSDDELIEVPSNRANLVAGDAILAGAGNDVLVFLRTSDLSMSHLRMVGLHGIEELDVTAASSALLSLSDDLLDQSDSDSLQITFDADPLSLDLREVSPDAGYQVLLAGSGPVTLYDAQRQSVQMQDGFDGIVIGGTGEDTLLGADGNDDLSGGDGNDTLLGNDGNDILSGGDGYDRLTGGAGNDSLSGGASSDLLVGGSGSNIVTGGAGADAFLVTAGEALTITDFDVSDDYERIDLRAFAGLRFSELNITANGGDARITLTGGTTITLNGIAASDLDETDFVFAGDTVRLLGETLSQRADFRFTDGEDDFIGAEADEVFDAIGQLSNLNSYDRFDGGAGTDTLRIFGNDRSYSPARLDGMERIEIIDMTGATGDLTFVVDAAMVASSDSGTLVIKHGANSLFLDTELVTDASHVIVEGTGQVRLRDVPGQTMSISDLIAGDVQGGNDGNIILGGAKGDLIRGLEGNDSLSGNGGNDSLVGGTGDDTLSGGGGDDVLDGGEGRDLLISAGGSDRLSGGADTDSFVIKGGAQVATLTDYDPDNLVERIDLSDITDFTNLADLEITDTPGGARITGSGLELILENVSAAELGAKDFIFAGQDPLLFHVGPDISTTDFQALLDDAPAGAVIHLAEGTYSVTETLRIDRSDISLIGAGEGRTVLITDIPDNAAAPTLLVQPEDLQVRLGTLVDDAQKGSNTVTLHPGHDLEVGDLLHILQANDEVWLEATGNAGWTPPEGVEENDLENYYLREARSKIVAIDGNTVTLEEALPYTFEGGIATAAESTFLTGVTLRDFSIEGSWGSPNHDLFQDTLEAWTSIAALELDGVQSSQIADITLLNPAAHGFKFQRTYEVEGEGLTAVGAHNKDGSSGYHFLFKEAFDNTFSDLSSTGSRHAVLFSSFSAEHYNDLHVSFTDRDINFHGSPDADNRIVVDRMVQSYPELTEPQWTAVHPGVFPLHPYSTIEDNDVTFRYAVTSDRGDTVTAHEDGGFIDTGYGNDRITGGSGNDTLDGGANGDTISGGDGQDLFIRDYEDFTDVILDFETGQGGDIMVLRGTAYTDFSQARLSQEGDDTILEFGPGGQTVFKNTVADAFTAENFQFLDTATAGEVLDARATQMTLVGTGNDDLIQISRAHIESPDLLVQGGGGYDVVELNVSSIFGSPGPDDAFRGIDRFDVKNLETVALTISAGLVAQSDIGQLTLELGDSGTAMLNVAPLASDQRLWVDGAREVTLFGGTDHEVYATDRVGVTLNGEDFADTLHGNRHNDALEGAAGEDALFGHAGNDMLNGGAGADFMNGGMGSDIYYVDDLGDRISESRKWAGTDHVYSGVDFITGRVHIEEITLTGSDNIRAIGNGLANTIRGNDGHNILDGKKQIDTMIGGEGNDLYVVSAPGEILIEEADEGIDTVRAYRSWKLEENIENLELRSGFDFNAVGNELDNLLVGNSGDNMLIGREGSDTLRGNGGADTFVFDRGAGPDNVDTIVDFTTSEDLVKLRAREFGISERGTLDADALHFGVAANSAEDRVIYDIETGRLWVDRDGSGSGEKELIAILQNQALIDATDFEFY